MLSFALFNTYVLLEHVYTAVQRPEVCAINTGANFNKAS